MIVHVIEGALLASLVVPAVVAARRELPGLRSRLHARRRGGYVAPLAVQPLCSCGHRYDHHDHRPGGRGCYHCSCGGYS